MVKLFPQFLGEPQLFPPETQRLQAYRGRGLGRKLLEVVEEFSRTARRIFVVFFEFNGIINNMEISIYLVYNGNPITHMDIFP